MKHNLLIIFLILFFCSKNKSKITGSDQDIAIKLAEEVWIKAYGKSEIKEQKPFVAKKKMIVFGLFMEPLIKQGLEASHMRK